MAQHRITLPPGRMPAQGPQAECRGDWEDPQSASRVVHGKANERHTWVAEASYSE